MVISHRAAGILMCTRFACSMVHWDVLQSRVMFVLSQGHVALFTSYSISFAIPNWLCSGESGFPNWNTAVLVNRSYSMLFQTISYTKSWASYEVHKPDVIRASVYRPHETTTNELMWFCSVDASTEVPSLEDSEGSGPSQQAPKIRKRSKRYKVKIAHCSLHFKNLRLD